jgi:hypothetical protein
MAYARRHSIHPSTTHREPLLLAHALEGGSFFNLIARASQRVFLFYFIFFLRLQIKEIK